MSQTRNTNAAPAGYEFLQGHYALKVLPHWQISRILSSGNRRSQVEHGRVIEFYPSSYQPANTLSGQLEFALKYEGVNLSILASLFKTIDRNEIVSYVQSSPKGKYKRKAWYLFEMLTGEKLPLDDLPSVNYIDILDPEEYYASSPKISQRQRIRDNLLGDERFCPTVRKTERLRKSENFNVKERCEELIANYPHETFRRALSYLYTRESKSSFEIEHIEPDTTRTERFIRLLRSAEEKDLFNKKELIEVQNQIVDERYRDIDFRQSQMYIGETVGFRENIHYIAPRPADVPTLMNGMFALHERLANDKVHPVVYAAVISFGFVYIHPFEDGNGRIHRLLIHNILARHGFTPDGVIFPVSAAMLANRAKYDDALEGFSKPLMPLIDYKLNEHGRMTVLNETADLYSYMDLTSETEALFEFIEQTIKTELPDELDFLLHYDTTKQSIQEIIDMPDRRIDLFIKLCTQNQGKLSPGKRRRHFSELTDHEVADMENAVQQGYEMVQIEEK